MLPIFIPPHICCATYVACVKTATKNLVVFIVVFLNNSFLLAAVVPCSSSKVSMCILASSLSDVIFIQPVSLGGLPSLGSLQMYNISSVFS